MSVSMFIEDYGLDQLRRLKFQRNQCRIDMRSITETVLSSYLLRDDTSQLAMLNQLLLASLCFLQTDDSGYVNIDRFLEYCMLLPASKLSQSVLKRTLFQSFHPSSIRSPQVSASLLLCLSDRILLSDSKTDVVNVFDVKGQPIERLNLKVMVNRFLKVKHQVRIVGQNQDVSSCQALSWLLIGENEIAIATSSCSIVFLNSFNYDIKEVLNIQRRIYHMKIVEALSNSDRSKNMLCWQEHNRGEILLVDIQRRVALCCFHPHGELCHFLSVVSLSSPPSCDSGCGYMATSATDKKIKLWTIKTADSQLHDASQKRTDRTNELISISYGYRSLHCHITIDTNKKSIVDLLHVSRHELLVGIGFDKVVHIWNSTTGDVSIILSGHASRVTSMSLVCDDSILTSEERGMFILWNVSDLGKDSCLDSFTLDCVYQDTKPCDVTCCSMANIQGNQMLLGLRNKQLFAFDCCDMSASCANSEISLVPLCLSLSTLNGSLLLVYRKNLFVLDAHSCQVLLKHDISSYDVTGARADKYNRSVTLITRSGSVKLFSCGVIFRGLRELSADLFYCTSFYQLMELSTTIYKSEPISVYWIDCTLALLVYSDGTLSLIDVESSTTNHNGRLIYRHNAAHDFSQRGAGIDIVVTYMDELSGTVLLCDGVIISSWSALNLKLKFVYFGQQSSIVDIKQVLHPFSIVIVGLCKNSDLVMWRENESQPLKVYKFREQVGILSFDIGILTPPFTCLSVVVGCSDGFVCIVPLSLPELDEGKNNFPAVEQCRDADLSRLRQISDCDLPLGPLGGHRRDSELYDLLKPLVSLAKQFSSSFQGSSGFLFHEDIILALETVVLKRWNVTPLLISAVKILESGMNQYVLAVTIENGEISFWNPVSCVEIGSIDVQNAHNVVHSDFCLTNKTFEESNLFVTTLSSINGIERRLSSNSHHAITIINVGASSPITDRPKSSLKRASASISQALPDAVALIKSPSSKTSLSIWNQICETKSEALTLNEGHIVTSERKMKGKQINKCHSEPNIEDKSRLYISKRKPITKKKELTHFGMYSFTEVLSVRKMLSEFIDPASAIFNLSCARDLPQDDSQFRGSYKIAIETIRNQLDSMISRHSLSLADRRLLVPLYIVDQNYKTASHDPLDSSKKLGSCPFEDLISVFFPGVSHSVAGHIWQFCVTVDHFERLAIVLDILLDSLKSSVRLCIRDILRSFVAVPEKSNVSGRKVSEEFRRRPSKIRSMKPKIDISFQESLSSAGPKQIEEFYNAFPSLWEITVSPHVKIMIDSLFQTLINEAPSQWDLHCSCLYTADFVEAIRETRLVTAVSSLVQFFRNQSLSQHRVPEAKSTDRDFNSSLNVPKSSAFQSSLKKSEGIMRFFELNGISRTTVVNKEMANRVMLDLVNELFRDCA